MQEAVIIDCLRTAVGKAPRGALRNTRPDDLAAEVIRGLLAKYPQIPKDEIEDLILGCAMPEAEAGLNMARNAILLAGLPDSVTGATINRFCSSGLQSIAMAADRIRTGGAHIILAGGSESMSLIPRSGHHFSPNPKFVDERPEVYMTMGLTAEEIQRRWQISREDQDAFALRSHQNAVRAQTEGRFDEEIVPVKVEMITPNGGKPHRSEITFNKDEGPRTDTSVEALAKLKPVFHANGTVTAGNASQTSEGTRAAADGAVCQLCDRRRSTRDHGDRAGGGDSEGAGTGRPDARRYRRDRVERSLRGAGAGCDPCGRTGHGKGERERRGDRARASVGMHWYETNRDHSARDAARTGEVRIGDDVRRRRAGRCRDFREDLELWQQEQSRPVPG